MILRSTPARPLLVLAAATLPACVLPTDGAERTAGHFEETFFCEPSSDSLIAGALEVSSDRQAIVERYLPVLRSSYTGTGMFDERYEAGMNGMVAELAVAGALGGDPALVGRELAMSEAPGYGLKGVLALTEPVTERRVLIDFEDLLASQTPAVPVISQMRIQSAPATGPTQAGMLSSCAPRSGNFCRHGLQYEIAAHVQGWLSGPPGALDSPLRNQLFSQLFQTLSKRGAVGGSFLPNRFVLDRQGDGALYLEVRDGFMPAYASVVLSFDTRGGGARLIGVERREGGGVPEACPGPP
jgi:hypothetical protein